MPERDGRSRKGGSRRGTENVVEGRRVTRAKKGDCGTTESDGEG